MDTQSFLQRVQLLIDDLDGVDFGYPLGTNKVFPPQPSRLVEEAFAAIAMAVGTPLREFYYSCDGFSLPDVYVGYFVKPLVNLSEFRQDSQPREVSGPLAGAVLPFGSTGGGDLFVLRLPEKDVLCLPPGPLHNGIYDGSEGQIKWLAPDFPTFLELLLDDIEAFVKDRPHHYLV